MTKTLHICYESGNPWALRYLKPSHFASSHVFLSSPSFWCCLYLVLAPDGLQLFGDLYLVCRNIQLFSFYLSWLFHADHCVGERTVVRGLFLPCSRIFWFSLVRTFLCVESSRWIRQRTTKNFFLLFLMQVIAKLMVISTRSPHDKILGQMADEALRTDLVLLFFRLEKNVARMSWRSPWMRLSIYTWTNSHFPTRRAIVSSQASPFLLRDRQGLLGLSGRHHLFVRTYHGSVKYQEWIASPRLNIRGLYENNPVNLMPFVFAVLYLLLRYVSFLPSFFCFNQTSHPAIWLTAHPGGITLLSIVITSSSSWLSSLLQKDTYELGPTSWQQASSLSSSSLSSYFFYAYLNSAGSGFGHQNPCLTSSSRIFFEVREFKWRLHERSMTFITS